jgi:hypothetical protein
MPKTTAAEKKLVQALREFEDSGQSEGRAFAETILDGISDVDSGEKIEHAEAMAGEFLSFAHVLLAQIRAQRPGAPSTLAGKGLTWEQLGALEALHVAHRAATESGLFDLMMRGGCVSGESVNDVCEVVGSLLSEPEQVPPAKSRAASPTPEEMREALMTIAHMRCDGDEWFLSREEVAKGVDGADISNDLLQDQMVEAVCVARGTLGIQESGPVREPTKVDEST